MAIVALSSGCDGGFRQDAVVLSVRNHRVCVRSAGNHLRDCFDLDHVGGDDHLVAGDCVVVRRAGESARALSVREIDC